MRTWNGGQRPWRTTTRRPNPLLPVLLRDPADLPPAERTHDLVAAVARDDLLAVVLVLQNSYPEEVTAAGQSAPRLNLNVSFPGNPDADHSLSARRMYRRSDRTDGTRNGSVSPDSAGRYPSPDHAVSTGLRATRNCTSSCGGGSLGSSSLLLRGLASLGRMANGRRTTGFVPLFSMRRPGQRAALDTTRTLFSLSPAAPNAVRLCFDMTMAQVEDWITEHGLEVPDSSPSSDFLPPPPSSSEAAEPPPPRTDEIAPTSPPAADAAVVKTQPV